MAVSSRQWDPLEPPVSLSAEKIRYTPQQHLALERKAASRSEYHDGWLSAMSGASREQNLIAGSPYASIHAQLQDRPCEANLGEMPVRVSAAGLPTYPEVIVVCGRPPFEDRELDTPLNPTLIVEILSESTEAYDRGVKCTHYGRLPSLRQDVLVCQDMLLVERFTRQGGEWLLRECSRLEDVVPPVVIGCEAPLRAIFAEIEFPQEASSGAGEPVSSMQT